MAQSKRSWRGSSLACLAALTVAFASQVGASAPHATPPVGGGAAARVSMMVEPGSCKPGLLEELLNDWLVSTKNAEFESDYAAMAFDELVDFVYLLRNIAQDFCV